MKKFTYTANIPCFTTIKIKGEAIQIALHNGGEYDLPANDPFILTLIAQGKLKTVHKQKRKKI